MLPATVRKVLADLASVKVRSALVALSIAIGVFASGVVSSTFASVERSMAADFEAANPHTARIYTSLFESSAVDGLTELPEIEGYEARHSLWVQLIGAGGVQYPINLDSVSSVASTRVDRLAFESGSTDLEDGEIYLERQGADGLGLRTGDQVQLALADGSVVSLTLVGTVHDVMANPFTFTSKTSGYVTPATMADLGGSRLNNYVSIVTAGSHTDADHVRAIAVRVSEALTAKGITVFNINITNPGHHPAQSIIDTVLMLLSALTLLVVGLSSFLVTNTVTALIGQQVRQIGIMKAVGATMGQVIGMYLGLLVAFGSTALLLAIPASAVASWGLSRWLIRMLNATPLPFSVPSGSLALQLVIGLAVPILGGLIPVVSGARRTVRDAISSYGTEVVPGPGRLGRLSESVAWLPRTVILSLRNAFRRKTRLVLTLATLVMGGAMVVAMFGVRESLYQEIERAYRYYQSDVNVALARYYPLDALAGSLDHTPGVVSVEGWIITNANVPRGDDGSSDQVVIHAIPPETRLIVPVMLQGRWLQESDTQAMVVSGQFMDRRPDLGLGDQLPVTVDGAEASYTIVGVFRIAGSYPSPYVYVPYASLAHTTGVSGQVNSLKIVSEEHGAEDQKRAMTDVMSRLAADQVEASAYTGSEPISQQRSQIDILVALLLAMGALIAIVGGLGLMGTMGMNVLERTREVGILRAIGSQNGAVFQMVVAEGAAIGVISWALASLAAIPLTHLLDNALGTRLMTTPILYTYSYVGSLAWLALALVVSSVASLLPARNAVRLSVRDALAYE